MVKAPTKSKTVSINIQVSRETFELLRDVALAHEITKVADRAGRKIGDFKKNKNYDGSISTVINELMQKHHDWLENEAAVIRLRRATKKP